MDKSKQKLAVFDIDGTIFRSALMLQLVYALVEKGHFPTEALHEFEEHHSGWRNRLTSYHDFEIAFSETYHRYIVGSKITDVEKISHEVVKNQKNRVYTYTRDLIVSIRKDYLLLAISGSPHFIVNEFVKEWNFDHAIGCQYSQDEERYGDTITLPTWDLKKEILTEFCTKRNLSLDGSIGVGDTYSDVSFLEIVDTPIAFNPNRELYDEAKRQGWKIVVERKDVVYELKTT